MMPYLSCKKIENDVYNFPTWQYCKYKDIFDSRIIINSTAKFYISISYHKDLLSIDTRIFTPSASLFMYIAFILISAVGTILAVQSLSDSTKYKYRYLTLRRLGINDKSLFKTIRKQLLILFCVPAISAILCSFVMMSSLNNVYQQILGDKHLYLMYFGLNLIIFFLIYSIYWIATYIGFKRNINEES